MNDIIAHETIARAIFEGFGVLGEPGSIDDRFRFARTNKRTFALFGGECRAIFAECLTTEVSRSIRADSVVTVARLITRNMPDLLEQVAEEGGPALLAFIAGCDVDPWGLLQFACRLGSIHFAELALERIGPSTIDPGLYTACTFGNMELVEHLIAHYRERTVLHVCFRQACIGGHVALAKSLAERCKPTRQQIEGLVLEALRLNRKRYRGNRAEMMKYLIENCRHVDFEAVFITACVIGAADVVQYVVSLGFKPDNINKTNTLACQSRSVETVKYLLELGAEFTADNFYTACETGDVSVIKFLIGTPGFNADLNEGLDRAYGGDAKNAVKYLESLGATCSCTGFADDSDGDSNSGENNEGVEIRGDVWSTSDA